MSQAGVVRARELDIGALARGSMHRVHIEIVGDGLGQDILIPILVARGKREGPVFGLTAAVHGNELNGIRVIHDLFQHLDLRALRGTVVGVVAINVPGLHNHERQFADGRDLNHRFPGRADGNLSEVYADRVLNRIVRHFDFLADLHTASFGRVNSLYVRADMTHDVTSGLAYLLRPQIIVHNPASDATLRGSAMELGIPSITVEIGDPQRFQPKLIRETRSGIRAMLGSVGMLPARPRSPGVEPILCTHSYWQYTDRGGLLEVLPATAARVEGGERVAVLRDAFGDVRREYAAAETGVVIGKSANPVGQTGARILHLGVEAPRDHAFRRKSADGGSGGAG